MTCRSFRRSSPLHAGSDLGGRKAERARAHLAACPACRRDAAEFEKALAAIRTWARTDDAPAWTEAEWRTAVRSASTDPSSTFTKSPRPGRLLRPVLAYGFLAVAVVGASFLLKPRVQPPVPMAGITQTAAGPLLQKPTGPHLTSIRFAAKSGRLEVVWFFNRDFPTDFYGK
jgi:anti-sigma factor RsiW